MTDVCIYDTKECFETISERGRIMPIIRNLEPAEHASSSLL